MPVTPIDVECQLFSGWRAAYICRLRRWHRPMLQSIYVAICHDSTEDALPRRRRRQRIVDQSHGLASGQCQIPRHGGAHLRRDEPQGGLRLQRSKSLFVGHQRHPQGIFFLFFFFFDSPPAELGQSFTISSVHLAVLFFFKIVSFFSNKNVYNRLANRIRFCITLRAFGA